MKILVIDDEEDVLKDIVKEVKLARDIEGTGTNGCEVMGLADFKEALRLVQERRFDAVITDMIGLGNENEGIEILRSLCGKTPITIVLTAHPSIPSCVEAMRAGAWDYIEKAPQSAGDVYEKLRQSLRDACRFRKEHPEAGRYNPDSDWISRNLDSLMKHYPGKLIAVLDQKVVDSDTEYGPLVERLKRNYPLVNPVIFSTPDPSVRERMV